MTTSQTPSSPSTDALVDRALSTVARADVPAGLADRAFAAAMRAPPMSTWTTLLGELFAVARVGAACAAGVATLVLVVSTAASTTSSTSAVVASAGHIDESDAWVSAVLPLSPKEESL